MEPIIVEIRLSPDTASLLKSFAPKTVNVDLPIPPQSPAEQAARMRMLMQTAQGLIPHQPTPTYPPQPGQTVNPTQATPMPSNRTTGAANMAPVAGPAPSQPAHIVPLTNPTLAGPSIAQPAAAQSSPAPVAAAPTYTIEQLQGAVGPLLMQGKGPQLQGLLKKYGVQRLPDMPADKLGLFAADLRGMGAQV